MNPETLREPSAGPAAASEPSAPDLKSRLRPAAWKAVRKLAAVPFADPEERRRTAFNEVAGMLNERVCTQDKYDDEAATIVGELVCELIPARGATREHASSPRAPGRSGNMKPTGAARNADSDAATSEALRRPFA